MSTSASMADLYPGLPETTALSNPVEHEKLMDWAKRFCDLLRQARDPGISAQDVAGRLESAIREAATAGTYSEALSVGIESAAPGIRGVLQGELRDNAVKLGEELADENVFTQWTELLGRDAIYVVALAMADSRAKYAARKTKDAEPALAEEAMF